MTEEIRFEVRGLPVPQGDLKAGFAGKRIHLYHAKSAPLGDWRHAVASAAQPHAPAELWDGPITVSLAFTVPRPTSVPTHRGRGKKRHPVRSWPYKRPDLDKFVRAVFDALTNVVFKDDGQVVALHATKEYGAPGVRVRVSKVTEDRVPVIPS